MEHKLSIDQLEAALQELEISTEYIDALNKLGLERTRKNLDLDRAFDVITQAQALCENQFPEYRKGLAEALINLAKYFQQRVDLEKSLRYIMQAGEICKELGDVDLTFLHNQTLFIVYQFSVDWNRALEVSIDSLRLAQAHRRTDIEAKALVSVAKMYTRLGEYAQATIYYDKALVMAAALNEAYMGAIIHLNVTYPHRCLGNYEQALHHASLAYDHLRGSNSENEAVVLGIFGHIYAEMAQHDRAMDYHRHKLKIADALDSNYLRAFTHSDIGAVHVAMGQITEGIQWLESGIRLAESQQLTEALVPFYGPLVQAYKANQDYEKALTIFEKLAALRAETQSSTALNQRNTLFVIHETEQAKLETQLHQERAERLHIEAETLMEQNALLEEIDAQKTELISLRTTENYRLTYAINQSVDGVIITDQDGLIQFANPAWATMHGYQPDTLAGRPLSMFFAPGEFNQHHAQFFAQVHKNGTAEGELTHLHREGRTFPTMMTAALLRNADGEPSGFVCIGRDIAPQKEAEANLKRVLRDLQRSNEDLKQFAFVTSHDLQEPLRTITSYLQLIQKFSDDTIDPSGHEFIQAAMDGAARMKKLMSDFLTFSQVETPDLVIKETDLNRVLDSVRYNLAAAINESQAVLTCDPLPVVMANETQITQLFQNLLSNAIKYHKPEELPQVEITAKHDARYWTITVRDYGIGYDPKYSEYIFEIFKRLHSSDVYEGTGVGLAICKRIVERHNGYIWSTSTPGEGATFSFTLPLQALDEKRKKC